MAIQDISLHELNSMIRETLNDGFPERYWVSAEISEASFYIPDVEALF